MAEKRVPFGIFKQCLRMCTDLFKEYSSTFSALTDYIEKFKENGYDSEAAESISSSLSALQNTPMSDMFSAFDANGAERCAVALGALVNFDRRAASAVSSLFGVPEGSITPEAVCELFFGVCDIFPLSGNLIEYSLLDRLFSGVSASWNAAMTLKPLAAQYISDGVVTDGAFTLLEESKAGSVALESEDRAEKEISSALEKGISGRRIIAVCGEEGSGRKTAAVRALEGANRDYVIISAEERFDKQRVKDLSTKLFLLGAVPVIFKEKNVSDESFIRFADALSEEAGCVIAICSENAAEFTPSAETVIVKTQLPSLDEQYRLWENELSLYETDSDVNISELAGEFSFTPGGIKKALRFADMLSDGKTLGMADIKNGCCRSANYDMGHKAVKINCVFTIDDIVLPEQSKRLLLAACDQVRFRHKVYDGWGFSKKIAYGKSVSMVFTGPPGTGKTMAAQIIAGRLGLDLYKISLANVVSKYIGETEKNLDEIFEKARKSKVVLFFDEADVLFSKRTEVKDSNDKYSNMESAFLLQKIEEYNGIVILATNLVSNFDEAFKRRMKLIIDFPFPDKKSREMLWHRAFPKELPLDNIDYDYLVNNFELTGSNIKNIALHSAFLAAAESSESVGMKHILSALKNEYSKSGKSFTKEEAGEYFYYIAE